MKFLNQIDGASQLTTDPLHRLVTDEQIQKIENSESAVIKRQEFVTTVNQTVFNITQGSYEIGKNRLSLYISGIKQPNSAFAEISKTSFKLSAILPTGTDIMTEWIEGIVAEDNSVIWENIENKPLTFTPSTHNHNKSQIIDFPSSLPANGGNADTVGGFTVAKSVPSDALFTDTNTVYNHPTTHPASIISIVDTGGNFTATNVEGAMSELFQSVSSGKNLVATSVTGKGVLTSGSDTFSEMATKIGLIQTGTDTNDATAIATDILSGKTAYIKGNKLTGTISSKSSQSYTPSTYNQTISSGQYLSGTQTILGSSSLIASNIRSGANIFGVAGNVVSGAGLKKWATGTWTSSGTSESSVTASGLGFTPSTVTAYSTATGSSSSINFVAVAFSSSVVVGGYNGGFASIYKSSGDIKGSLNALSSMSYGTFTLRIVSHYFNGSLRWYAFE